MSGSQENVPGRVLVIEDEELLRDLLRSVLEQQEYIVDTVGTCELGLTALERDLYDVVLLDLSRPGMHGLNVLSAASVLQTDARFIVMSAFDSVVSAVEAMNAGAFDYIIKPFRTDELILTVHRARREVQLRREVASLRRRTDDSMRSTIIGRSPVMNRMFDLIERLAPSRATALIIGETGTGKELVARAIHDLSDRARKPFVAINCSALPETLLESELFGHTKGSFTGAIANKRGLFEEASGGTLFLDEVSTITHATQVKLLRVLQERKIQRVGSGLPVPVDFRLIAATNVDLAEEVRAGHFREDLYYRLNVFPIRLPPLRERTGDIPILANYFRARFAQENGIEAPPISPETMARLVAYPWPGNVRELENFMERAVIMYAGARSIPFEAPTGDKGRGERQLLERAREKRWTLEQVEKEYILDVLASMQRHRGRAAEILGIDRRTLYRKLKEYQVASTDNLEVPAYQI